MTGTVFKSQKSKTKRLVCPCYIGEVYGDSELYSSVMYSKTWSRFISRTKNHFAVGFFACIYFWCLKAYLFFFFRVSLPLRYYMKDTYSHISIVYLLRALSLFTDFIELSLKNVYFSKVWENFRIYGVPITGKHIFRSQKTETKGYKIDISLSLQTWWFLVASETFYLRMITNLAIIT